MDFKKLAGQAKTAIDKRGGTEGLKEDFGQLRNIAKGDGTLTDKAKAAAAALKQQDEASSRTDEAHAGTQPAPPPQDPGAPTGSAADARSTPKGKAPGHGEHHAEGKRGGERPGR
jgi:hypothetical protein